MIDRDRGFVVDCCSIFTSDAPEPLPSTRRWHRIADRFLAATRPGLVMTLVVLGALASLASAALDGGLAMLPLAVYFFVAGGWCVLNFVRSREAHCVATGFGWVALAGATLLAAATGRDGRDGAWLAFFMILAVGISLEMVWVSRRGTTALRG